MFTIIGNIKNLPSKEGIVERGMGRVAKEQLATNPTFVSDLRIRSQKQALSVISQKSGSNENTASFANAPGFERIYLPTEMTTRLASLLGLTKPHARLQILEPGNMTLMHLDDLDVGYMNPIEEGLITHDFTDEERLEFKNNPRSAVRYLIPLEDWQWGQGMMFQDKTLTHWKSGDIIYWDWPTVVHSTFNTGFWSRGLIRITGLHTIESMEMHDLATLGLPLRTDFK